MKTIGLLFFGAAIPFFVAGLVKVPQDSWVWLGGILCSLCCMTIIWRFTDNAGHGPPLDSSTPEWLGEQAKRRYLAAHPEAAHPWANDLDFRTDEDITHEPLSETDDEEEIEELPGMASRMGLRVRVPGKH